VPIYEDVRSVGVADGAADVRLADGRRERQVMGREGEVVDSRQAGKDESSVGVQDAGHLDSVDLLCGGFPCQDLSVAGQRRGLAGARSGLFFEFARIIDAFRPRWVLVENVPGLLSSNGGRDFGIVVGTLADLGYGVGWRVLDSRFFGVPQRRRRVFIVGAESVGDPRAAAGRAGQILGVGSRCPRHPATRGETRQDVAVASLSGLGTGGPDDNEGQGGRLVDVAYSLRGTGQGHNTNYVSHAPTSEGHDAIAAFSENQRAEVLETPIARQLTSGGGKPGQGYSAVRHGTGVRRLTPRECERLQALPDDWTAHGPDSRRYAALGDAVTSSVAEWIGRRILTVGRARGETE
jgi:DNA (cytosine-5)-methyltransferase 1